MTGAPPRLAQRLLGLAIRRPELRDGVLGDLAEEFAACVRRDGLSAARRWYWRQALAVALHFVLAPRRARGRSWMPPQIDPPVGRWTMDLRYDLRAAWRSVRQQPAVSATIVLTLALGLAANAVIFALGDALVLRPFRFAGVDRTVVIASVSDSEQFLSRHSVTPGDFVDWTEQAGETFSGLSAIEWWDANLSGDALPEQVPAFRVSPSFFWILSVRPALGRAFTPEDAKPGAARTVVLAHGLWQRRFGGDASIVGRTIQIDGEPSVVVGVAPKGFGAPFGAELWAPLVLSSDARLDRSHRDLMVIGRLRDGVSLDGARARMRALVDDQRRTYPSTNAKREVTLRTYTRGFGDPATTTLIAIWQAAAMLLLLVGGANVVNLLLARGVERQREFAIRLAVGAGRGRIVCQLLVEGLLLSTVAVTSATVLAWVLLEGVRGAFPPAIIRWVAGWDYMHVEPRTLAVTATLAVLVTLVTALVPALKATRSALVDELRQGARLTADTSRHRLRMVLATVQVALTIALLAAAGLTVTGVERVTQGPLGFTPSGVLTATITLTGQRYLTPAQRYAFIERVLNRLRGLPSVNVAAATNVIPYSGANAWTSCWTESTVPTADTARAIDYRAVTPDWLDALRVPLLRGRALSSADRDDALPVALLSESAARQLWPGQDALGRRFRLDKDGPLITTVGVVGDVAHHWLFSRNQPTVYRPMAQATTADAVILLRVAGDPADLGTPLRAAVAAVDSQQPVASISTYPRLIADSTFGLTFAARSLMVIAAGALLVSVVGVYSLMVYLASRRTRELGVRIALGATRAQIVGLTVAQGLRIALGGAALGLILALILGKVLERYLFGVVAADYMLTVGIAVTLALVAIAASYVPARRAAAVDPLVALRAE
jgi:predicted permease